MTRLTPRTIEDVQEAVRAHGGGSAPALRPVGAGTKSALAPVEGEIALDVTGLEGILEYQPQECTFTALAGTRIDTIAARVAEHGHYLPFDPPFAPRGATIGGTVATALSGPARFRYGGVRDFLLGVRFVDGDGRIVRGGGRVVKNAAGFYLHHLQLGSLGRLGVITEVTCKVFPRPAAVATLRATYASFDTLLERIALLRRTAFEIESIEMAPPGDLFVRLGGTALALTARANALSGFLRDDAVSVDRLDDDGDARVWQEARELEWASRGDARVIVKVATTLGAVARLEPVLAAAGVARRYGMGGEITWLVWDRPIAELDRVLSEHRMAGVTIAGAPTSEPFVGVRPDAAFLARVRRTFDPRGVFANP